MTPPKLIGLVRLELPKILSRDPKCRELGKTIAFDDAGRAWLLVERLTDLGETTPRKGYGPTRYGRVDYVRWQLLAPLAFVEEDPVEFFVEGEGDPAAAADGSDPSEHQ
jgi:hypothetical protein